MLYRQETFQVDDLEGVRGRAMAEPNIDAALYTKLTEDAGIAASEVGDQVYYGQAPQGTGRPYIIFAPAGGGEENVSPRRSVNEIYRVEAVSDSKAEAVALDSLISAALHEQQLNINGWDNYDLQRESKYAPPVENIEGKQVWRRGAYYRIRLASATV